MGRAPCCEKVGLKKGRWTAEEDQILVEYIKAHGEGSWRSLPKNAGLLRCGKSCRLRWVNYLREDLKRGNISAEEEEIILNLQATLGNRWSLIAARLPGRTDNEIKNYWNAHLCKKAVPFTAAADGEGGRGAESGVHSEDDNDAGEVCSEDAGSIVVDVDSSDLDDAADGSVTSSPVPPKMIGKARGRNRRESGKPNESTQQNKKRKKRESSTKSSLEKEDDSGQSDERTKEEKQKVKKMKTKKNKSSLEKEDDSGQSVEPTMEGEQKVKKNKKNKRTLEKDDNFRHSDEITKEGEQKVKKKKKKKESSLEMENDRDAGCSTKRKRGCGGKASCCDHSCDSKKKQKKSENSAVTDGETETTMVEDPKKKGKKKLKPAGQPVKSEAAAVSTEGVNVGANLDGDTNGGGVVCCAATECVAEEPGSCNHVEHGAEIPDGDLLFGSCCQEKYLGMGMDMLDAIDSDVGALAVSGESLVPRDSLLLDYLDMSCSDGACFPTGAIPTCEEVDSIAGGWPGSPALAGTPTVMGNNDITTPAGGCSTSSSFMDLGDGQLLASLPWEAEEDFWRLLSDFAGGMDATGPAPKEELAPQTSPQQPGMRMTMQGLHSSIAGCGDDMSADDAFENPWFLADMFLS